MPLDENFGAHASRIHLVYFFLREVGCSDGSSRYDKQDAMRPPHDLLASVCS